MTGSTKDGSVDIFVAKLEENGNESFFALAGGSNFDEGNSITTDSNGDCAYVTGTVTGDYTTFGGMTGSTNNGDRDIFVAKLDKNGNEIFFAVAGCKRSE